MYHDVCGQVFEAPIGRMTLSSSLEAECFVVLEAVKLITRQTFTFAMIESNAILWFICCHRPRTAILEGTWGTCLYNEFFLW